MKLITEVALPDYPFKLDHQHPILMTGSCFTENIGRLLERFLFPVCVNPFGVTYNPLSVKTGLENLVQKERYTAGDLDLFNELWFSFDHYTGFSSPDRDEALENINRSFIPAKELLKKAGYLILTWGTSWVFRYNKTGEVVCNCHKIPAREFTRVRLTPGEIISAYEEFLPGLFAFNPDLKIIHTVSPVRHWKDGAHGNQLSKASLLLAGEALQERFPDRFFYFPSYEIVMDELRDYRFYADDLVHTSGAATQYLWEKFDRALLSEASRRIISELDPLIRMRAHRSIAGGTVATMEMEQKRDEMLQTLMKKYPHLAWENLPDIE